MSGLLEIATGCSKIIALQIEIISTISSNRILNNALTHDVKMGIIK